MQRIAGVEAARQALQVANQRRQFGGGATPAAEAAVRDICARVQSGGDEAIVELERRFDCPTLTASQLRVPPAEIEAALKGLDPAVRQALEAAAANIAAFHQQQPRGDWEQEISPGLRLGQRYTPLERVGLYAPCGRAVYPSTVLMLAVPARIAGVPEIVLATPPQRDGSAHPLILAAAAQAGITEIYRVGGAVAMAALAYGSPSIPPVHKLVGPGNLYVTLAKKHLYGQVGIDGLYGPSEVVILADGPGAHQQVPQIAADLLAQAEHGEDSFVCCVTTSDALADLILAALEVQAQASPRHALLQASLQHSLMLVCSTLADAVGLVNLAAAEHVEIWSHEARSVLPQIQHGGGIFLNTPVPFGDYVAGPSHTLPTGTTARFAGGVGVDTFLKRSSVVEADESARERLRGPLEVLAGVEGLPGHAGVTGFQAQP